MTSMHPNLVQWTYPPATIKQGQKNWYRTSLTTNSDSNLSQATTCNTTKRAEVVNDIVPTTSSGNHPVENADSVPQTVSNNPESLPSVGRHKRRYYRGRYSATHRSVTQRKNVLNLSDRALSEDVISILSKGLMFVPAPTEVNRTELTTDLKYCGRRMRLKEYFLDENSSGVEKEEN